MVQAASFRGIPFAVTGSDMGGGRRMAVHQYPGRDEAWAEDMGRTVRNFRLRGFILDGDIITAAGAIDGQRSNLITALEKSGEGTLIHPTLGSLTVVVDRFTIGEGNGAQSYSNVEVSFIESGTQTFPSATTSSTSEATAAADELGDASSDAFDTAISAAMDAMGTVEQALAAATSWVAAIESAVVDATAMYRLAAELVGSFGRYSSGANSGVSGRNSSPYASGTAVADLVPIASANREGAKDAAAAFLMAVQSANLSTATDVEDITAKAQAMIAALVDACADPADTIRLLLSLLKHEVAGVSSDTATAINHLVVRLASAALTSAVTEYQPQSADDAAARMTEIGDALYDLMIIAGDAGDDDCFAALRKCRGAVVNDLRTRGVTLAILRTFTFAIPLPSLVLAQSIYTDASRADELVTQVDPRHPLFMPGSFQALAA